MVSMFIFKTFKLFLTKRNLADFLMFFFIIGVTVGAGMIFVPAGLIAGGLSCGLYGYLLGTE